MIRPYAAFNVLPTEVAESGRSRTKLLPASNAIADCLVLSVIAKATVVWLEGESRTRSRIALLGSPNLRSTTTVSNSACSRDEWRLEYRYILRCLPPILAAAPKFA